MNQQAADKSNKFRMEIRKRQRQGIMRKQRQLFITNQLLNNNELGKDQSKSQDALQQLPNLITDHITQNSIKGLYKAFGNHPNYMNAVPQHMIATLIQLIISKQSIETNEGVQLLGLFILYCCGHQANASKRKQILQTLQKSHIQQQIFKQIQKSIECQDKVRVKLLANCLKVLALNKFEPIRRKDLLQIHLGRIIENYIGELSVLIFLVFVSEVHPFNPQIVRFICQQSKSQESIAKASVSAFLNNFVSCEKSEEIIASLFETIMSTLQFLMINCKGHSTKLLIFNLEVMIILIGKYPSGREVELLTKISKCKLQQLAILLLNVSDEETKQAVFQLEECIIDKTIDHLKQQFFLRFSMEVIYQIAQGIEYTRPTVIWKCLKIIAKLVQYASAPVITKIRSENMIEHTLEQLCYHKDQTISILALNLLPYFSSNKESSTMEQC